MKEKNFNYVVIRNCLLLYLLLYFVYLSVSLLGTGVQDLHCMFGAICMVLYIVDAYLNKQKYPNHTVLNLVPGFCIIGVTAGVLVVCDKVFAVNIAYVTMLLLGFVLCMICVYGVYCMLATNRLLLSGLYGIIVGYTIYQLKNPNIMRECVVKTQSSVTCLFSVAIAFSVYFVLRFGINYSVLLQEDENKSDSSMAE